MDRHCIPRAGGIPVHEEIQNEPVVRQRHVLHVLAVLRDLHDLIYRAVNNGIQPPHVYVVGRLDQRQMELLVCQRPVAALPGDPLYPRRLFLDHVQFLVAGALTRHRHSGRLKNQAHFKQILRPDLGVHILKQRQVHCLLGQVRRHKGSLAPLDLQNPLCHQKGDRLPQGRPADAQQGGQLVLIGQLAARLILLLIHDHLI